MAVQFEAIPFDTRLQPGEIILRDGGLSQPAILTGCKRFAGTCFCKFQPRKNDLLSKFLTGRALRHSPLAHSTLGKVLAALREAQTDKIVNSSKPQPEETDVVDDLGLDSTDSGTSEGGRSRKKADRLERLAVLLQHPLVTIDFPVGDGALQMRVLTVQSANEAVSFEALPQNFAALYQWCVGEAPLRKTRELAKKAAKASAKPKAKQALAHGGRQYFRKDKQVEYVKFRLGAGRFRTEVANRKRGRLGAAAQKAMLLDSEESFGAGLADESSSHGVESDDI